MDAQVIADRLSILQSCDLLCHLARSCCATMPEMYSVYDLVHDSLMTKSCWKELAGQAVLNTLAVHGRNDLRHIKPNDQASSI